MKKLNTKLSLLIALIILTSLIGFAGCGGGSGVSAVPNSISTSAPTSEPTSTPTSSSTLVPTPTPLPQSTYTIQPGATGTPITYGNGTLEDLKNNSAAAVTLTLSQPSTVSPQIPGSVIPYGAPYYFQISDPNSYTENTATATIIIPDQTYSAYESTDGKTWTLIQGGTLIQKGYFLKIRIRRFPIYYQIVKVPPVLTPTASPSSATVTATPGKTQTPVMTQTPLNTQYTLEQAMSDNAQLSTIAFSGLAFITGSSGADTFFPPGKVADFFGFQYMRDVDTAGYGHNTTFLSKVANNVIYILNDTQKAKLVALAKVQASIYTNFAYNRFPLMNAFRRSLEGAIPTGSTGLNTQTVAQYTANLYKYDADLSYNRAVVVGEIINSFTDEQKAYLAKMEFNNYLSWPVVQEAQTLKQSLTNPEFIAVMTYASELFSWYKGSVSADIYFCPERHGTYFGAFFMKDYPAMNDPNYFIDTTLTGNSGQEFLKTLTTEQKALITGIIDEQRSALAEIAQIRTTVSNELRKAMTGGTIDKEKVYTLIRRYGELDGQMSALYAIRFTAVNKTLTDAQKAALVKLRNLTVVPTWAYRFSDRVDMPAIPNTDYMFGIGTMPGDAGQTTAPESFGNTTSSKLTITGI